MARKRLNDTAAIVAEPLGSEQSMSVSVRKIDNGYVTRTSHCDPRTGAYNSAETFSKNPPRIIPARVDGRQSPSPDQGNPLRDAKMYLGDDV